MERNVKYQGVSLPKDLLEKINMNELKKRGFTSKTDFIKTAIRNELQKVT
jgi:metal-responsive CopG/Arc/MetJ family transcriptional regulator